MVGASVTFSYMSLQLGNETDDGHAVVTVHAIAEVDNNNCFPGSRDFTALVLSRSLQFVCARVSLTPQCEASPFAMAGPRQLGLLLYKNALLKFRTGSVFGFPVSARMLAVTST